MFRRFVVAAACVALAGAGCTPTPPVFPDMPDGLGLGAPSPDGSVAFERGFGALPSLLPATDTAAAPIVLEAEMPPLPSSVTVLRDWSATSDGVVLRNLANALRVPAGALGEAPREVTITASWRDADGLTWTEGAEQEDELAFERAPTPADATQGDAPDAERAAEAARMFFKNRGIDTSAWGEADVNGNRVSFAAARDGLGVVERNGTPYPAARVEVDANGQVMRGMIRLARASDRSNYPALSSGDVLARLRAGGTNPIPAVGGGVITVRRFITVTLRHQMDVNGTPRAFYVPALLAEGTLRRADGAIVPYATTVPLVRP